MTKIIKQDNPPYLSTITNLQVGQSITHLDSNGTHDPSMINKIMIFSIFGDPMYLI